MKYLSLFCLVGLIHHGPQNYKHFVYFDINSTPSMFLPAESMKILQSNRSGCIFPLALFKYTKNNAYQHFFRGFFKSFKTFVYIWLKTNHATETAAFNLYKSPQKRKSTKHRAMICMSIRNLIYAPNRTATVEN